MADISDMSAGVSNPMFGDEGSMYDASPKSADSRLDDNVLVARLVARIAELEEKLYARDLQDSSEMENSSTAFNQLGRLFSNVTNGSWGSAKPAPVAVLPEDTKAEREANVLAKQIAATAIIETADKLRVAKEANKELLKKLQDVEAVDCQLRAELQDRISVLDTQVTSSEGEVQRLRVELDETKARCEAMQEAASAGARLMADLETVRGHLAGSQAELKSCRELWLNEREARRKLHDQLQELRGNIRVLCRVRPVLGAEPEPAVVDVPQEGEVVVRARDRRPMPFEFNVALGAASTQEQVFAEVEHLITSCFYGRNVCVFAYGQTGSGKTYTMEGTPEEPGIYLRAMALLFKLLDGVAADAEADGSGGAGAGTRLEVSMMEVYNDDARDLLANGGGQATAGKPLVVSGMGPGELPAGTERVPGLRWQAVEGLEDVREALRLGHAARATAATALNCSSSRSHALFSVRIHRSDPQLGQMVSTLSLVDLAGSERVAKSEATGAVLKEAQHINRSLSALGDVISALQQRSPHIPYRNSKITQVLQDSLSPLSKVLMVCCLSPDESCAAETLSSLNFASRANSVELAAGAAAAAPARARQRSRPGDARRS